MKLAAITLGQRDTRLARTGTTAIAAATVAPAGPTAGLVAREARALAPPCAGLLALALALPAAASAQEALPGALGQACRDLREDGARLACYDDAFREGPDGLSVPVAPAQAAAAPTAADGRVPFREYSLGLGMARSWEVTPESKSDRFMVKTYEENYLLPIRYTSPVNRTPSSPTQGAFADRPGYRHEEAALQLSLRTKLATGLFGRHDSLWGAYTQTSAWQLWDAPDSRPFRNTDYQPEIVYVTPVPDRLSRLPGGWRLRMLHVGAVHQSNGQSDPLSRSWNRLQFRVGADNGRLGLMLGTLHRLPDSDDDNPDLVEYLGNVDVRASMGIGYSRLTLSSRLNPQRLDRGSVQLGFSHPVYHDDPAGLRWYLQVFSGYGQTLLDYNVRQTSVGAGVMLFQF